MKKLIITILLIILTITPATSWAEEIDEPATNYCHDKESWDFFDSVIAKHPGDVEMKTLYAVRVGFCSMIERGMATVDEAQLVFETMRQGLIDKRKRMQEMDEQKEKQTF